MAQQGVENVITTTFMPKGKAGMKSVRSSGARWVKSQPSKECEMPRGSAMCWQGAMLPGESWGVWDGGKGKEGRQHSFVGNREVLW